MFNSAALGSLMTVAIMMLSTLGAGVEAAPTDRGFVKPPHALPSLAHASAAPEKTPAFNPNHYLKHWLLSTKGAGVEGAARITDGTTAGTNPGPDKRAQMLKMISALEELHRTFNATLSSRITIMARANGRGSGRKNKVPPATDGVKATTVTPAAADSTASRASADAVVPSLTGRNFKKSLPPQTKKTNKRVCFWKYCSQN